MKLGEEIPRRDVLDDEAAAWLCASAEGFTPERAAAFSEWCTRDPRHAAAVRRVERLLALLDEMPAVRERIAVQTEGWDEISSPAPHSGGVLRAFPAWATGLAAVLVVGVVVGWLGVRHGPERHVTNAASQELVTLRDGSIIRLNAASEVRVDLGRAERRVTLERGEAHFQVASDPARPFIVTAGALTVRAVGTAFNVRLEEVAVDVLVVEGKVEVTRRTPGGSAAVQNTPPPILGAGQRIVVPHESPSAAPIVQNMTPASMHSLLGWQGRMTTFLDTPLRDVVEQFNRRNATQLILADLALGERKIGGVIPLDQFDAFVRLLEQEGDIVAERRGTNEILLRRAR